MRDGSRLLSTIVGVLLLATALGAQVPESQNPWRESVPSGQASSKVIPLSLAEAIAQGLRSNLGLLLSDDASRVARGERWHALSRLLPTLETATTESQQEINLHALIGAHIPPALPAIAGPFHVFDARAYATAPLVNLSALRAEQAARQNVRSATYTYRQARDTVVLAVGNAYLMTVAAKARVAAARAEVRTAQALYELAADREHAGLSPEIDTLRAHVELKAQQESLLAAENEYETDKLTLARLIGLPDGQRYHLVTAAPYAPLETLNFQQAVGQAYLERGDYQAAQAAVRSAEAERRAVAAERYPTLSVHASADEIGLTLAGAHPTYAVAATVQIPVFQGGRVRGELQVAEARLRQRQQELSSLHDQIAYEIRTALLNLKTSASQVAVARSNIHLAHATLQQARDRFATGVADNIEVVEAQQAAAQADDAYISSLYQFNLSKLSLARAMGVAERDALKYLGVQNHD